METEIFLKNLNEKYLTYDPYDIWKSDLGHFIKKNYYKNKYIWTLPAAFLTIFDLFFNNRLRLFYKKTDTPIVHAFLCLIYLEQYKIKKQSFYLEKCKNNLEWLIKNKSKKISNFGWGLNFRNAISENLVYSKEEPYSTITPYILEAFYFYKKTSGDIQFDYVLEGIYQFFLNDINIIKETDKYLVTSYSSQNDRIVINALSYTMYAFALFSKIFPERKTFLKGKILKLYTYIVDKQNKDGSWYYSPEGNSFVDCFHSAFILKNIYKTHQIIHLENSLDIINNGLNYIESNMRDTESGLFRRFSISNKTYLIKYDLYDNAEMLNLYKLLGQKQKEIQQEKLIENNFVKKNDIYSGIDVFGRKRNKNMLRWAAMPYFYAKSKSYNSTS